MDNLLRNALRMLEIGIYPLILLISFLYLYHKPRYKKIIKTHWKHLLLNTIVFALIGAIAIIIFFRLEDTIYAYDYAGHWQRSLELRKLFFEDPSAIFNVVYESMNYQDYSYLPGLFGLGLTIWNTSYGYFCLTIFSYFIIPSILLLQIIYYTFTDKYPYLPLLLFIIFYPLYFTVFYGEVDGIGLFFILMIYLLMLLPQFEEITWSDATITNLYAFCAIFLRRWYLYPLVFIYLCIFIKYLIYYHFKVFIKGQFKDFIKIILSGLIMLVIILLFFFPFFERVLFNNYAESYAYYDRPGKISAFINFYSPILLIIALFGIYHLIKNKNYELIMICAILLILPTVLFWQTQSFEYHHYYISTIPVFILFMIGMMELLSYSSRIVTWGFPIICLIQAIGIFTLPDNAIPVLTSLRKKPEVLPYKAEVSELAYFLRNLMPEDWQSAYIASGNSSFNDSMIRNSVLPDLDMPQIDFAVLDLRDGFPKDLEYVQYVITIDPILYSDKDYQHIYDVISNAIWNEPLISEAYKEIYSVEINQLNICVYERIADYTPAMKEYFYKQMISYYPDHQDFFAYILD